jgi:hypothetical protein
LAALLIGSAIILMFFASCAKTAPKTTSLSSPPPTPTSTLTLSTLTSQISNPVLTSPASAADIVGRATQAKSGLQYYLYDRDLTAVKYAKADKSDMVTTKVISKNVALDLKTRRMQMDNKILFKQSSGQLAWPLIENSIFIDNNTMYIQGLFPSEPLAWTRTPLTEDVWQKQNLAIELVDLLNPNNLSVLSPEVIRIGDRYFPCDVLRVSPGLKDLWGFLEMQPGIELPSGPPEGVSYERIIKSSEITLWVSQSGGLLVQAMINVHIVSLSSAMNMDINLNLLFIDYNKPVSIQVSPEALAAKELNFRNP